MKINVRLFSLICLLGIAPITASAAALSTIRLAASDNSAQSWDIYVAQSQGYFEQQGLAIETKWLEPDQIVPALIQGEVDIAVGNTFDPIIAQENGKEMKIVAGKTYTFLYEVVSSPKIN